MIFSNTGWLQNHFTSEYSFDSRYKFFISFTYLLDVYAMYNYIGFPGFGSYLLNRRDFRSVRTGEITVGSDFKIRRTQP